MYRNMHLKIGCFYTYAWGNNPVRRTLKGKRCRLLVLGKMNSCLVIFSDGSQFITSQNSLK